MTDLMFIHGTGVRAASYRQCLATIREAWARLQPGATVHACYWGDWASRLHAGGACLPRAEAEVPEEAAAPQLARWSVLHEDPLAELRMLAAKAGEPGPFPSDTGQELQARIDAASLDDVFAEAQLSALAEIANETRQWLARQRVFQRVMKSLGAARTEAATACAQALIAELNRRAVAAYERQLAEADEGRASDEEIEAQLQLIALENPTTRDALVESIVGAWTPGELAGLADLWDGLWLGSGYLLSRQALSRQVARNRASISNALSAIPGDILYYQSKGEAIEAYIAHRIQELTRPTVLLAHSLGSVAVVDAMVRHGARPPEGSKLVTLGSPVGLFYEFGALRSLDFGKPLPAAFPKWLNLWDPLDVIAHLAAWLSEYSPHVPIRDVEVDNGRDAVHAHNAYWESDSFWEVIDGWLGEVD